MKLTIGFLTTAKPRAGRAQDEFTDDKQRGLVAVVGRTGVVTFCCRYSVGKKRHRDKLGKFPALSLAEARAKAAAIMAKVDRGLDPATPDVTFVWEAWARYWPGRQGDLKHPNADLSYWRRLIAPVIRDVKLAALGPLDYDRLVAHWKASGLGPGQATALRVCQHFEGWLLERRLIERGFVPRSAQKAIPAKLHPSMVPPVEVVRELYRAAEDWGRTGAIVRMLILTGGRRAMLQQLQWAEVVEDADGRGLAFSPERMKSARPFWIPLSSAAAAIIDAQPPQSITGSPFVFPAIRTARSSRWCQTDPNAFCRPVLGRFHLHDLRKSLAHHAKDFGVHMPGVLLDHAPRRIYGDVTTVYLGDTSRFYAAERRAILESWAALVAGVVSHKLCETLPLVSGAPSPNLGERPALAAE